MKKILLLLTGILLVIVIAFFIAATRSGRYSHPQPVDLSAADSIINRTCQIRTLRMDPDYEGEVVATLLSHPADSGSRRAVLYIHGFGDYFFQSHLADWYRRQGFNFYALELRKYGHSWLAHQKPNYMRDVSEYFPEINRAIEIITEADSNQVLLLNGHSTGGLTASIYTAAGRYRDRIDGLFLNSPFLDWKGGPGFQKLVSLFSRFSAITAGGAVPMPERESVYTKSLHQDYFGRWDFNTVWKPIRSFPIYFHWLKAINRAHRKVDDGLGIICPVLVFHSDRSYFGDGFSEEMLHSDAVLDVDDIHRQATRLGANVTCRAIPGGMHDIFLSSDTTLQKAFQELERWMISKGLAAKR